MNIAVKVLNQSNVLSRALPFVIPTPQRKVVVVVFAILFSALSLVYVKDLNRRLFIDSQGLQQNAESLQVAYSKLTLEESAWATPVRVQKVAEQKLDMQLPSADAIVLVK
jgi:cell division protein FtsL